MSYILEALRKADAERERGSVPDLHAQPLRGAPSDDEAGPSRAATWLWPVLGVALVLIGTVAWSWLGNTSPPVAAAQGKAVPSPMPLPNSPPVPAPAPHAPLAAQGAAVQTLPMPAPNQPEPAMAQPPPAIPQPAPAGAAPAAPHPRPPATAVAAAPAPLPAKAAPSRSKPAVAPKPLPRAEKPAPEPSRPAAAKALAQASPSVPAARLPQLNELPDELRRDLPPLAIGGSVYSPQAERRMVIVNGQVFVEGATLAPELHLEQIRPKSAVFSIRGQRFELPL